MSDSMNRYWKDYISQMSASALIESSSFMDHLLSLDEVNDSDLVDLFLELSDMFRAEGFLRYSKIIHDLSLSEDYLNLDSIFSIS